MERDVRDVGVERLPIRSPTSSISAARSSCVASAWPTLFTVPSSATRWRVSWTRRAFSSATLTLPAELCQQRSSASVNACSRSTFWSDTTPAGRPPANSGTKMHRLDRLAAEHARVAVALGQRGVHILVDHQRLPRLQHVLAEADQRHRLDCSNRSPRSITYGKRRSPVPRRSIEMLTTCASNTSWILLPTSVVDRLRVELAGDGGLDAVDERELGVALPSLVDEPRVLERDAEAARERRQQARRRLR